MIECFFDCSSPWTWLAFHKLRPLAAELGEIADGLGIDAAALLAAINTPEVKAQLKANTDEAIVRGAFGSPTIFVGADDMYFGSDRLPLVREAVLRRRAS